MDKHSKAEYPTNDPFEQHFQDWYRGVQLDARAQREQRNMQTLIQRLINDGHNVTHDYMRDVIIVDQDTPVYCEISAQVAREMFPERLIDWVNAVQFKHIWKVRAKLGNEKDRIIITESDIKALYLSIGQLVLRGATEINVNLDKALYVRYNRIEYYPADKQTDGSQEGSNDGE